MNEERHTSIKFIVLVAYVAMVVVNILASTLPINGVTPGQVSDSYPNLFAPAGFTFSIWALIYVLLGGYALYQMGAFRGYETPNEDFLNRVGVLFVASSVFNIGWIFSWHYRQIFLALIFITAILVCLIMAAQTIDREELSQREKVYVRLPFGVYFGWLTVATIANATVWLVSIGWKGLGLSPVTWTVLILLVGMVIGVLTLLRFKCTAYGLVLMWAYFGILMKHLMAAPKGFAGHYPLIIMTIGICLVVFFGAIVYILPSQVESLRKRDYDYPV